MDGLSRGAEMTPEVNVIVGAGQAGAHAAMAMRAAGFQGRIVLVGEEPERPYERPPLSKEMLLADPEPPPAWFHAADKYAAKGIELRTSVRVEGIDAGARRLHLADGTTLAYDRALLATGGCARPLAVPGGDEALTLRTLEEARRLRRRLLPGARVVIIGAGVIGLEIASAARRRGAEVTVIEALPGVMGRCLTPPVAERMERLHRDAGVALVLATPVQAIEPGRVLAGGKAFAADLVVAGIGMVRNTELAAAAGAAVENGVLVDAFGRSSLDGLWAAGDVAAFHHPRAGRRLRLESWRHAMNHGLAVGGAMGGVPDPYDDVPWFWSDQFGHTLQVAGLIADAVRSVPRGDLDALAGLPVPPRWPRPRSGGRGNRRPTRRPGGNDHDRGGHRPDPAALADPGSNLQALARRR